MADNVLRGPPSDLPAIMGRVQQQYPALSPYLGNASVQWGGPQSDGRQLEFYPPWERDNPNPGRTTLELYKPQMQGNALVKAIGGDMLHHLGGIDPNGNPVDPQWLAMKRALVGSLTPDQLAVDKNAHLQAQMQGDPRSFDDWMQSSRADAYIRGKLTPDAADQWKDVYNPQQNALLAGMRQYLSTAPVSPQNMPPQNALNQITSRGIWDGGY